MSPPTVVRVLAFLDPGKAVGANITVLQYTRDESAGWVRDTYDTLDQWKVVDTIKQELSIGDDQDYKWGVSTTPSDGIPALKVPMAVGVKEVDPLAPILEIVSDPEALIDDLVETGYAAAKAPTDFPASGDPVEKTDLMAEALMVQGLEMDPSTLVVAEYVYESGLENSLSAKVTPTTRVPITLPSPWAPGECELVEWGGQCIWVNRCPNTRTQNWLMKRTKTCTVNGLRVVCNQSRILTCTETIICSSAPVPGRTGAGGQCLPPSPPYPAPVPCLPVGTDVTLGPPSIWDKSRPSNCTGNFWAPSCACD